jgi:hypothetical protein
MVEAGDRGNASTYNVLSKALNTINLKKQTSKWDER